MTGASQTSRSLFEGRVVLVDNLLSEGLVAELWKFFLGRKFRSVHSEGYTAVYRLTDGEGLASDSHHLRMHATPTVGVPDKVGSSGNPLSVLFQEMLSLADVRLLLGGAEPWSDLGFACQIYRQGSGLNWHADGRHAAAFIYYVHPQWEDTWGGELLLETEAEISVTETGNRPRARPHHRDLYASISQACTPSTGFGYYVAPVPNRLVVLQAGVRHCIKKVDSAAGEAFRSTISGFFTCRQNSVCQAGESSS